MVDAQISGITGHYLIPAFMMLAGSGMVFIWSADILKGTFRNQGSFFRWREGENMLWPHIMAEFLTGAGLIISGIFLMISGRPALFPASAALGALIYSALNSSGWVLAEKERLPYGFPMWISLAGGTASFIFLLLQQSF